MSPRFRNKKRRPTKPAFPEWYRFINERYRLQRLRNRIEVYREP